MSFKKIEDSKWEINTCKSPEHNPPMHIVLQPGNYEWTCPQCGNVQIIIVPEITI